MLYKYILIVIPGYVSQKETDFFLQYIFRFQIELSFFVHMNPSAVNEFKVNQCDASADKGIK
jgi:hypothetical protein